VQAVEPGKEYCFAGQVVGLETPAVAQDDPDGHIEQLLSELAVDILVPGMH
jgi:hypothetical protein